MAKKPTQEQRVVSKLKREGFITRNECLKVFPCISRLSGIIQDLEEVGWEFDAGRAKIEGKDDYRYKAIKTPFKTTIYVTEDGRTIQVTK